MIPIIRNIYLYVLCVKYFVIVSMTIIRVVIEKCPMNKIFAFVLNRLFQNITFGFFF